MWCFNIVTRPRVFGLLASWGFNRWLRRPQGRPALGRFTGRPVVLYPRSPVAPRLRRQSTFDKRCRLHAHKPPHTHTSPHICSGTVVAHGSSHGHSPRIALIRRSSEFHTKLCRLTACVNTVVLARVETATPPSIATVALVLGGPERSCVVLNSGSRAYKARRFSDE